MQPEVYLLQPNPLTPNTDAAIRFLKSWPTEMIHLIAIPVDRDGGTGSPIGQSFRRSEQAVKGARQFIERHQGRAQLYFSVNDIAPPLSQTHNKASLDEVQTIVALHVDADAKDTPSADVLDRLKQLPFQPSDIIETGHGLGLYWRLAEPTTDKDWALAANIALRDFLGGDNCQNLDRIMRVPGTVNCVTKKKADKHGYDQPVLAAIHTLDNGNRLAAHAIVVPPSMAPKPEPDNVVPLTRQTDLPAILSPRIQRIIVEGDPAQVDRSKTCWAVNMAMAEQGVPYRDAVTIMTNPAYAISAHYREQANPIRTASNDYDRAQQAVFKTKAAVVRTPIVFEDYKNLAFNEDDDPDFLVEGFLPREGLVLVVGPQKEGKSFTTFDMMMHVTLGWKYRNRFEVQQGRVLYCAFEGGKGYLKRISAFRNTNKNAPADIPFTLMRLRLNIIDQANDLIESYSATGRSPPAVVVLDTLNRSIKGSESSDEAMAAYIEAADRIRHAFHCCVVIVHHSGWSGLRSRGHSSLPAAIDVEIHVSKDKDGLVISEVVAARDWEIGIKIASRLKQVEVGRYKKTPHKPETSCIVEDVEVPEDNGSHKGGAGRPAKTTTKAKDNAQQILDLIKKAENGLTTSEWKDAAARTRHWRTWPSKAGLQRSSR